MTIKERLNNDIKDAMRAKEKNLLATLRLISAAVKRHLKKISRDTSSRRGTKHRRA
jgi:uncharacterized protein YqeY